jgi:hypothetical protein
MINYKRREQGTGNREQIRNFSSEFKAQSKKTVSLFQSHVFKHEFFLFPVPSEIKELDFTLSIVIRFLIFCLYLENII